MKTMKDWTRLLVVVAVVMGLLGVGLVGHALATDSDAQLYSRSKLEVSTGTAYIDTSAAVYTSYITLITITNPSGAALEDVRVVVDLDKDTTGFADASGYDTETIQLSVARKVDGTNYRTAVNLANTALAADDSDALSVELWAGDVGPNEAIKVMVKLSAEAASDVALPYVVTYRASSRAVVTPATN